MEKTRLVKQKAILLAAGCLALAVVVAVTVFFLSRKDPAPSEEEGIFHFQPGQVTWVYLQHYGDMRDVTDPAQVEEIVELLNSFPCLSSQDVPPAVGWDYRVGLSTDTWSYDFTFSADTLRIWNDDGSSTIYFGPAGYLQPLVDMADGTVPVTPGEIPQPEGYPYHIEAEDVAHLYIEYLQETREINSREDVQRAVELLNSFPCQSIEEDTYVPTDWWSFSMDGPNGAFFGGYFTTDSVRISGNTYHGPEGYFQPLMDIMEAAPPLPEETTVPDVSSPSALESASPAS